MRDLVPSDGAAEVYKIKIRTGDVKGAETSADVYITLTGSNGESGAWALEDSMLNARKLERGQLDEFWVSCHDLGVLRSVLLELDSERLSDSWFVEYLEVVCSISQTEYLFPCHDWLGIHRGDRASVRELVVAQPSLQNYSQSAMVKYKVIVATADAKGSATDGDVDVVIFGTEMPTGI